MREFEKLKGKKILVVDDLQMNQLLMGKILDRYHIRYEFASNGQQAVHRLEQGSYDMVLMDLQMPVMNGFDAIKKIRTEMPEPANTTPIIGISASIFNEELRKCMDVGANDFIAKPYEAEDLFEKMSALLTSGNNSPVDDPAPVRTETASEKEPRSLTNLEYLEQYAAGDRDFMKEMLGFFLENTPQVIQQMEQAAEGRDYETLYQLAHKFAPQLTFVGITVLIPKVEEIEILCRGSREDERIRGLLSQIHTTTFEALEELKKSGYL